MFRDKLKNLVDILREQYEIAAYPIGIKDLRRLAKAVGAEIRYDDFGDELSGFSYQRNGLKVIGVNSKHSPARQKFTIAHELGHLFLHKQNAVNFDEASILLRDSHSSEGTDTKEIEANGFAAELLMPQEKIREELVRLGGIDMEDEKQMSQLANHFGVSKTAITVRLTSLYLNR